MYHLDAVPRELLTLTNPKVSKGVKRGYATAVLHLAPAELSGTNVCPHATAGCRIACLNTAGRGGMGLDADGLNPVQAARIQRTRFYHRDPVAFWAMLERDLRAHVRKAEREGLQPAVRLNGTSDIPWERVRTQIGGRRHRNVMEAFPGIQFYDYTKARPSQRGWGQPRTMPNNYRLTFSLAENNDAAAEKAWAAGWNVAVVFRTAPQRPLPKTFRNRPVIDGDQDDLRFLDPPGVIVGLRAKGRARDDHTGFVKEEENA